MTRRHRDFSLDPDVVVAIDARPAGTRSATVSAALRAYFGLPDPATEPPLVQRVLERLRAHGPATARQIADALDETGAKGRKRVASALDALSLPGREGRGRARRTDTPGPREDGQRGPAPHLWEAVDVD